MANVPVPVAKVVAESAASLAQKARHLEHDSYVELKNRVQDWQEWQFGFDAHEFSYYFISGYAIAKKAIGPAPVKTRYYCYSYHHGMTEDDSACELH